jgi:hypothetical protein
MRYPRRPMASPREDNPEDRRRFRRMTGPRSRWYRGSRVGEIARSYVPGGVAISLPYNAYDERIAVTRRLLEDGARRGCGGPRDGQPEALKQRPRRLGRRVDGHDPPAAPAARTV